MPRRCRLHGTFTQVFDSAATPPVVGRIVHGGPHAPVRKGSLVLIDGYDCTWRVMSRYDDDLRLMRNDRRCPTKKSVQLYQVVDNCYEELPVYSIHGLCKSCRALGEYPVRTVQLIWDDRIPTRDGSPFVRPILSEETWNLQELNNNLYHRAVSELEINEDHLNMISGNSIPHRMLLWRSDLSVMFGALRFERDVYAGAIADDRKGAPFSLRMLHSAPHAVPAFRFGCDVWGM